MSVSTLPHAGLVSVRVAAVIVMIVAVVVVVIVRTLAWGTHRPRS